MEDSEHSTTNIAVDYQTSTTGTCSLLCTTRWRLAIMIFVANALLYMHRVNLSFAIVCMGDNALSSSSPFEDYLHQNASTNKQGDIIHHSDCVWNGTNCRLEGLSNNTARTQKWNISENSSKSSSNSVETNANKVNPEPDWDKSTIAILLSSYFYGALVTQIPAGRVADIFGAKYIITASMVVSAICSLLTPLLARTSIYCMFASRIITGLAGGTVIPSLISMFNVWAPPDERAPMIAVSATGYFVGVVFTYFTSGFLCSYGFDNGWPSIFYVHGTVTVIFICVWWYDAFNKPSDHPRISQMELEYLNALAQDSRKSGNEKTPWKRMLSSKPMLAAIVTHFTIQWSFYTILINVPMFMKEVLTFDIKQNGLYSSLPYLFFIVFILLSAKVASILIKRRTLKVVTTRRLFTALSLLGSACCLVVAGHVTIGERFLAVVLVCVACIFQAMAFSGFFVNHPEFAGRFSGTAYGITNGIGVVAAILSSISVGLITPNGLQQEWQIVFYIAAAINLIGTVVYTTWSSSSLQDWAIIKTNDTSNKNETLDNTKPATLQLQTTYNNTVDITDE